MKKVLLSIIAAVCCFTASAVGTQPTAGDGSKASPYQIATLENLLWFADYANSDKNHASTCAILTADITMNEGVLNSSDNINSGPFEAWTPIGNDVELYFGEFNGNGHTISGLYLENTGANNKQHQARVEATCLTDGNIEYWHCPDCSTYFTNEACTASTTDYIIAALGHDFTYTPYRTSTCTSEGDVKHWHCNRCGKDFNVGEQMASEDHVISGSLKIPCKESDATVVGMDNGRQKGVGFYNWSGRPLGAHKAYLRWSGSKLTSSGSFGFVFDDGTVTGIGSQEIPFVPDATCTYNLSGIPVDDSYDGIVIKDGKKYISNGPM